MVKSKRISYFFQEEG